MTTGWTDFTVEQLPERMAELEEVNEEGESGYYTEFNVSSTQCMCVTITQVVSVNFCISVFE